MGKHRWAWEISLKAGHTKLPDFSFFFSKMLQVQVSPDKGVMRREEKRWPLRYFKNTIEQQWWVRCFCYASVWLLRPKEPRSVRLGWSAPPSRQSVLTWGKTGRRHSLMSTLGLDVTRGVTNTNCAQREYSNLLKKKPMSQRTPTEMRVNPRIASTGSHRV